MSLKHILIGLIVFIGFSCSNNERNISSIQVSEEQPPVEQGEVWGAKEMEHARLIRNQFKDMLLESTGESSLMRRDAHPKHHGCVKAQLSVDNSKLDLKHRVGLFAQNGSYDGMVRFSNGDPNHLKSDKKSDVRGMAVKLFDVPYEHYLSKTQVEPNNQVHDFVFMNSKEFFIKDPKHYGKFMGALKDGSFSVASFGALAILNPQDDFVSILARAFRMTVGNPLDIDYHSATPYKLGSGSMKMKFKTCKTKKSPLKRRRGDNYLAKSLKSYLHNKSTCFDFYVQVNNDPRNNNIENSQKVWSTSKSPYIKVGRLNIPQQSKEKINSKNEVCESTSFNPWRAPEENRPLGGVNRIRLEVYIKQAKMRHSHNGVIYPGPQFNK